MFIPSVSLSFSLSLNFFTSPLLLRACVDLWIIHIFSLFFPVWILSRKPWDKIVTFVLSWRRSFIYAEITIHLQCKCTTRWLFSCVRNVKFLTHSKFGHCQFWTISIRNRLRPYMSVLVGSKAYTLSLNRKEASLPFSPCHILFIALFHRLFCLSSGTCMYVFQIHSF